MSNRYRFPLLVFVLVVMGGFLAAGSAIPLDAECSFELTCLGCVFGVEGVQAAQARVCKPSAA